MAATVFFTKLGQRLPRLSIDTTRPVVGRGVETWSSAVAALEVVEYQGMPVGGGHRLNHDALVDQRHAGVVNAGQVLHCRQGDAR